jgi:hypothetical protein
MPALRLGSRVRNSAVAKTYIRNHHCYVVTAADCTGSFIELCLTVYQLVRVYT